MSMLSCIISAQNYFQLPTLHLSHIYTPTPHSSMDFHLSPYNHHQTTFIAQPSINMSNPDDLKSVFEDSSDIEMEEVIHDSPHVYEETVLPQRKYNQIEDL